MDGTTSPRARIGVLALLSAAVVAFGAAPALAQDALIIRGRFVSASRDPGQDLGPAPDELTWPLASGGRYAASGRDIRDLRSGRAWRLADGDSVLAVDPLRPRLFLRRTGATFSEILAYDLTTGQTRQLTTVTGQQAASPAYARYAPVGDRLFLDLTEAPDDSFSLVSHTIQVLDASTGTPTGEGFTVDAPMPAAWLVTPEGDRAYFSGRVGFVPGPLTMVDVPARRTTSFPSASRPLLWDALNERLYAAGGGIHALTRDLTPLGSATTATCTGLAASPHTGRLYVVEALPYTAEDDTRLTVVDSTTYAPLGGRTWRGLSCAATVLSPPGPPRAVRAAVSGGTVALSWTPVGDASHFVLDVGVAPGRTDLSVYLGPDSHVSFAGVPSGTYYVRLRGGNEFGGGRPSQEITLVVP